MPAPGDASVPLATLHAESSGLKAWLTQRAADGIEALRKLCGGHGYSASSGLPELSANFLALATLEGTQHVLEPQAARFILKELEEELKEELSGGGDGAKACGRDALAASPACPVAQLAALTARVHALARAVTAAAAAAAAPPAVDGAVEVLLGRLSRARAELVLLRDMAAAVDALGRGERVPGKRPGSSARLGTGEVACFQSLRDLLGLFLLTHGESMAELLAFEVVSPAAALACDAALLAACADVKPSVVALVDAWAFSDAALGHSAIGCFHADDYARRLAGRAAMEPLNDPAFDKHLPHIRRLTHRSKL